MGAHYLEEDNYGKYFILSFSKEPTRYLKNTLKSNEHFHSFEEVDNEYHIVFKADEDIYNNVLQPISVGAYSKVDSKYVDKYFKPKEGKEPSLNYLILTKSPDLIAYNQSISNLTEPMDIKYWYKTKLEIPEGAEV